MITIPSISDINDEILTDLTTEFDVTLNPLGLAFLTALAGVLSGLLWLIWLYIGNVQKNEWFTTADPDQLIRWGFEILGRYPFQAQAGVYVITVTGTVGATIPASTVFKSDDTSTSPGQFYLISGGAHVMVSTSDPITVKALAGGLPSKLVITDTLTATAPLINVDSAAVVASETTAPIDAETMEAYRSAIREKVQLEAGSWSNTDYRLVGIGVAGVGQTYAYATSGSSAEVDVYLQGTVPGTPIGGSIITAYTAALAAVLPLDVYAAHIHASSVKAIDVTITAGTFTPFTSAQQVLIRTALQNFINSVHPFMPASDVLVDRNDTIATFNLNSTITAAVPGYGFTSATFTVAGTPSVNWQADNGEIPFFNSVTFI